MSRARDLADSADKDIAGTLSVDGLTVYDTNPIVYWQNTTTGQTTTDGFSIAEIGTDTYINNRENGNMLFYNNASERMRITSDGRLLVGKSTTTTADEGVVVGSDGFVGITRSGNNGNPLSVLRRDTDGDIIQLYKNTTQAGSIGVSVGSYEYMHLGSGPTGLQFTNAFNQVSPYNPSTLSVRDNAIDLGGFSNRWKDLYLSGGVYLGGTGAANYLDDYEEGTWTPGFISGGGTVLTTIDSNGTYVKIGSVVYISFRCTVSSSGSGIGSSANITGLPFAIGRALTPDTGFDSGAVFTEASNISNVSSGDIVVGGFDNLSSTQIRLYKQNAAVIGSIVTSDFSGNEGLRFSGFYFTDS